MYTRNYFGSYYPVDSAISRLNPVIKLLNFIICLVLIILSNNLYLNLFIFGVVFIMMLLSFVPLKYYFKTIWSLRYIFILVLFVCAYLSFNREETLTLILKIISVVEYLNVFAFSTSPSETVYALEKILFPLNIFFLRVSKIALKINNVLRYIPNLLNTENIILKAQANRGLDYYHSNVIGKIYAVINTWKNTIKITNMRNREVYFSSELKLYNSRKHRTNYNVNKIGFYDIVFIVYHLLLIVVYLKINNIINFEFLV